LKPPTPLKGCPTTQGRSVFFPLDQPHQSLDPPSCPVKGACDQLKDAPSYNWIYTELKKSLFKPYEPEDMERR
jgi:hypothetical protein